MEEVSLRPAEKADSPGIARLFLISSDGLAEYIWSRIAGPGEDLAAVGARRYAREGVAFSYQNCLIAERGGEVAGMLHAFRWSATRRRRRRPTPSCALQRARGLRQPLRLGRSPLPAAPRPGHRDAADGRGRGARALGLPRVSLICFERNEGAMRLYRRLGYAEVGRRPVVPHPTLHYADGDAILLARRTGGPASSRP
jgi:hypothetical protein